MCADQNFLTNILPLPSAGGGRVDSFVKKYCPENLLKSKELKQFFAFCYDIKLATSSHYTMAGQTTPQYLSCYLENTIDRLSNSDVSFSRQHLEKNLQ